MAVLSWKIQGCPLLSLRRYSVGDASIRVVNWLDYYLIIVIFKRWFIDTYRGIWTLEKGARQEKIQVLYHALTSFIILTWCLIVSVQSKTNSKSRTIIHRFKPHFEQNQVIPWCNNVKSTHSHGQIWKFHPYELYTIRCMASSTLQRIKYKQKQNNDHTFFIFESVNVCSILNQWGEHKPVVLCILVCIMI